MKLNEKEKQMVYRTYLNEECKLELYKSKGASEPGFVFKGSSNSLIMMLRKLFKSTLENELLTPEQISLALELVIKEWEEEQNESK